MKKIVAILTTLMLMLVNGGYGSTDAEPIIKTITEKVGTDNEEYSIIYNNGKRMETDEFVADESIVLLADNDDFQVEVENGRVSVNLKETKLTDVYGKPYESDEALKSLLQCVADNAKHEIFDVKIIIDGEKYFVFEKLNVNLQTPCILYRYDMEETSLIRLCQWIDVDLLGIAVCENENNCDEEIIGGADGATSVFQASKTVEGSKESIEIEEDVYSEIIDRVLGEYKFQPVPWNNTMDWKEDADVLVQMAEDPTGRYKAYGIISKEAGAYGIVLNDTIDGKDSNMNYVYEKWFYTGNEDGEPEFTWKKEGLCFSYPIPVNSGFEFKTVGIDCGYDTGHMELKDE